MFIEQIFRKPRCRFWNWRTDDKWISLLFQHDFKIKWNQTLYFATEKIRFDPCQIRFGQSNSILGLSKFDQIWRRFRYTGMSEISFLSVISIFFVLQPVAYGNVPIIVRKRLWIRPGHEVKKRALGMSTVSGLDAMVPAWVCPLRSRTTLRALIFEGVPMANY